MVEALEITNSGGVIQLVISKIIGGLGNQMFQYAAGRALAERHGVPLCLDLSGFQGYRLHQGFELNRVFRCETSTADTDLLRTQLGWRAGRLAQRILRRPPFAIFRGRRLVVEPHFHYWAGIFDAPCDCYLNGHWQSEKYFKGIEKIIRSDFTFRTEPEGENEELARQIAGTQAVSLHVRRGDYVSDAKTRAVLNLCSLEYYQSAIRLIAEQVEHPHFYIFSDDIDWVKSNLMLTFPCSFIDYNRGKESYNDMRLMSLCRHHIIANSSFSWWGAWLGKNPEKIVMASRRWFVDGRSDRDLVPDKWVRL